MDDQHRAALEQGLGRCRANTHYPARISHGGAAARMHDKGRWKG
jgi:hypothetical protein